MNRRTHQTTARLVAMALAGMACLPAMAQQLAKHAAAFKGDRGVSVVVAPTADDKAALVRVQGINHPVDGVVFLADKVADNKRLAYRATLDGQPWNIVVTEDMSSWGSSYSRTMAYVPPNMRDGVGLYFDEKAAKGVDLAGLTKTYQQQKAQGVQAKLAQFDRSKSVANTEQRLQEADGRAAQSCGAPIKTTVNWGSFTEEHMRRISVAGYCQTVADAMRALCTSDSAFKAKAAQNAHITCQLGDKLNLNRQGDQTVFTTQEGAPNQDDFALQYLRNQ